MYIYIVTCISSCRGVRQGDVLSPLLFNSALGIVMRIQKARARTSSWDFLGGTGQERLSNIRYADDLMLFGNSISKIIKNGDK